MLTNIITKPVSFVKGSDNLIQVNKANLLADAKVQADLYFAQETNWKHIILFYKTDDEVGQTQYIATDATDVTPEGNFNITVKALDNWICLGLVITDFDDGEFRYDRTELDTAHFDISLA